MFTFQTNVARKKFERSTTTVNQNTNDAYNESKNTILKNIATTSVNKVHASTFNFDAMNSENNTELFVSNIINSENISPKNSSLDPTIIFSMNPSQPKLESIKKSQGQTLQSDNNISIENYTSDQNYNYISNSKEDDNSNIILSNPFLSSNHKNESVDEKLTPENSNLKENNKIIINVPSNDNSYKKISNNSDKSNSHLAKSKLKVVKSKLLYDLESKISEENSFDCDSERRKISLDELSFKNQLESDPKIKNFIFGSIKKSKFNESCNGSILNTNSRHALSSSVKIQMGSERIIKKNSVPTPLTIQIDDDFNKSECLNIPNLLDIPSKKRKKYSSMIENSDSKNDNPVHIPHKKSNLRQKLIRKMKESKLTKRGFK